MNKNVSLRLQAKNVVSRSIQFHNAKGKLPVFFELRPCLCDAAYIQNQARYYLSSFVLLLLGRNMNKEFLIKPEVGSYGVAHLFSHF